jgi:hypothetical protein
MNQSLPVSTKPLSDAEIIMEFRRELQAERETTNKRFFELMESGEFDDIAVTAKDVSVVNETFLSGRSLDEYKKIEFWQFRMQPLP